MNHRPLMRLPDSPYDQIPGETVPEWNRRRVAIALEEGRECTCGIVQKYGEGARFSESHGPKCPAHHSKKKA